MLYKLSNVFVMWLRRVMMTPVSKGIAGYRFDAQDDTQLTIYPGDEVAILQKVGEFLRGRASC